MHDARVTRPVALTGTAVGVGIAATLVVALTPDLRFAYRSESAHLVLETADAGIAALVAVLLYGRFQRSKRLTDLLLSYSMALVTVAALGFATIPLLAGADHTDTVTTWAPLAVRLAGALLFAIAALTPQSLMATRRAGHDLMALAVVVGAILAVSLAVPHAFPVALDPSLTPENSGSPALSGHPAVLAAQAADFLCYAVACVAFTRRARTNDDELTAWIGAGAGLSAMARVNYMLFPSLFSEYVYIGDFLRTAFYLLLLVGAAREVQQYWSELGNAAALGERQRLARELHDGLTQELTFIWGQLQRLSREPGRADVLPKVTSASERALDEARRAIAALTRPMDEPLAQTLAQSAEEVAKRYDAIVELDLQDVTVDAARRESMIRIVREAVANAVRHSGDARVRVRLRAEDVLELSIVDCGRGFDYESAVDRRTGYGLTTMRQRAEITGGRFRLCTSPGEGTTVSVVWDG